MYSDRVDSVTRATNPSLLSRLPSTLHAVLLVRRPPPSPTRHLPMHRHINHGLVARPDRVLPSSFLSPSFYQLFLSFSRHLLNLVVFRCAILLSRFSPYSLIAIRPIFLLLIPLCRIPTFFVSLPLFHHLILSPFPSCLTPSFSSFSFLHSISRYVLSSLTYREHSSAIAFTCDA